MTYDEDGDAAGRARIDRALRKAALVWFDVGAGRESARWYAWTGGHLYLLTGGEEQPNPGLVAGSRVRIVVPSKGADRRLLAFDADVGSLRPGDSDWDEATPALARARLNLRDSETAPARWRDAPYALFRLTPALPPVDLSAVGETRVAAPFGDTPDGNLGG